MRTLKHYHLAPLLRPIYHFSFDPRLNLEIYSKAQSLFMA